MAITTAESPVNAGAGGRAQRRHSAAWVWQVTLLSLLLGAMLALALQTEFRLRPLIGHFGNIRAGVAVGLKQSNERLQEEVITLNKQKTELEKKISQRSDASTLLATELQDAKLRAGLLPVKGPGIIVTLRDSPDKVPPELIANAIIHDSDINAVLSELKAAGAEALGISGADTRKIQRVIYRTTARCTGPGMDINDTRLGGPYRLYAVGSPKELRAQLEMNGGVIKELKLDVLHMAQIEEAKEINLPEYSGSFSFKYAKPADTPR
jgi:uncharacterized protein YlxW (UPF0749 family)